MNKGGIYVRELIHDQSKSPRMRFVARVGEAVLGSFKSLDELQIDPIVEESKLIEIDVTIKSKNHLAKVTQITLKGTTQPPLLAITKNDDMPILVLVNPASGSKKAPKIGKKVIKWLNLFQINHVLIETTNNTTIQDIDYALYSKIIFISGDGLLHDYLQVAVPKGQELPVCIVAGGTGNALATALDCLDPQIAILSLLCGQVRPIRLMAVTYNNLVKYSFIGIYWGLVADIDLGTDKFRALGPFRMTIGAIHYVMKRKIYRATLICDGVETEINATSFLAMRSPFLDQEHLGHPRARLFGDAVEIVHAKMKRTEGLQMLLNGRKTSLFDNWHMISCQKMSLHPHTKGQWLDIDGESIPTGPIHAEMTHHCLHVCCPPWLDEEVMVYP